MRRSLVVLAVTGLVLTAACDGDGATDPSAGTVGVGALPDSLPGATPATTATSEPAATASTEDRRDTTTTTLVEVSLATALADLVGGEVAEAPPSDVVVDGTGRLRMAVPAAWGDRRTDPAPLPDDGAAPSIAAAADQTAFLDGYDEPGLTAVIVDTAPAQALAAYAFDDCTSTGRQPFTTARLRGYYEAWQDCAGSGSSIVTVAARQARVDGTVLVLAQVAGPDDLAALDRALATLRLRD